MKTQQEFKVELNRKINEINAKIVDVRKRYTSSESKETQEELLKIVTQLESLRNKLISHYEKIENVEGTDDEFSELKKNIYKSLESFDATFSKAGSIAKSRKFLTREHSTDFKNPLGNK
jgi:predicted  nucleic acid-binding Zn-ribbon protein